MDEQGFTEWAVGRQRLLLRSAYLLTGDAHRAEDLVQEALTRWRCGGCDWRTATRRRTA